MHHKPLINFLSCFRSKSSESENDVASKKPSAQPPKVASRRTESRSKSPQLVEVSRRSVSKSHSRSRSRESSQSRSGSDSRSPKKKSDNVPLKIETISESKGERLVYYTSECNAQTPLFLSVIYSIAKLYFGAGLSGKILKA